MKTGLPVFLLLFLLCSTARADIYRWVDDQGTLHFTDDPSTIPAGQKDRAAPIIREAPEPAPAPPASSEGGASVHPAQPMEEPAVMPAPGESEREALARQVEQLQAKIEAKEKLIRQVDEKRSLSTNPYRNRVVDAYDMELYRKYQIELPNDRERLINLESRLKNAP
jgi:hypothetical protein